MTWLKVETNTPEKPEVWAMSGQLSISPEMVFVKLFKVWRWFDEHTEEGNAVGVTKALVDSTSGVAGFADAMVSVKWLIVTEAGISLPKFDRHNGESAKKRANTAVRVAKHKGNAKGNAESVTEELPNELPREEKRREEKKETNSKDKALAERPPEISESLWSDFLTLRKAKKAPLTESALQGIATEAGKAGMTLQAALSECCARGWQGFKAEWVAGRPNAPPSGKEKFDPSAYVNRNRKPPNEPDCIDM